MRMLGEMFDLCMLKVVQVAIILTEQAPSFSKLSFNWHMSKTIIVWTAKPHSPGIDAIYLLGLRSKWLFINIIMVLEVNTKYLCLHSRRWFETAVYRDEIPPWGWWYKNLGSLLTFLLFWDPLETGVICEPEYLS